MSFKNILTEVVDRTGVITINRPKVLNALDMDTISELDVAVRRMDDASGVRVVVLAGAGDKAFAAGADIDAMQKMSRQQAEDFIEQGHRLMSAIERCTKPVVAAVRGYALGGGTELALACDIVYAADDAKFGLPEVRLGIFPGFGGTQRLALAIGPSRAREMILSGRTIDAAQAYEWGLVNRVVPAAELKNEVNAVAAEIAANAPLAVAAAKEAINSGVNRNLDAGIEDERALFVKLFNSADREEGMSAFLKRGRAVFRGK